MVAMVAMIHLGSYRCLELPRRLWSYSQAMADMAARPGVASMAALTRQCGHSRFDLLRELLAALTPDGGFGHHNRMYRLGGYGLYGPPCHPGRAVLNAKKRKWFQNQVISKEPTDSTCLHPGVPNCSTMSP